jgi:hypothetical protein
MAPLVKRGAVTVEELVEHVPAVQKTISDYTKDEDIEVIIDSMPNVPQQQKKATTSAMMIY